MNQTSKTLNKNQTLADILKRDKDSSQCSLSKIAISNNAILSIGKVIPPKYTGVTHLLLSNNHMTSLSGIEAFQNLTHLSIASNDIESISELTKIHNKGLIVSLSVKKNFFLKNPQSNIDLITLFPNIKYLDGFKISDATHKVISESGSVSYEIMSFVLMIQHKLIEVSKLYSMIKLNDEFTRKKGNGMNSIEDIDTMIGKCKTLLRLNRVKTLKEDYIKKYLNRNINPSVHVLKKIMKNTGLDYNEDYGRYNGEEYSQCYEALFSDIISLYESKNNYNELPFYLNYMILKDNPLLAKFLLQKMKEQQGKEKDSQLSDEPYIESISSIVKEFNSLFIYYTNYSIDIIIKYQMMYFHQINKQSDILYDYHPVAEDMKIFFDQSNANCNGNEKIDLDAFNKKVCLFLLNAECDSFPVFALNFDYMRNLTTVIQNRIIDYKNKTDKIIYFLQLLQERKKMFIPVAKQLQRNENDLFKYHFPINNMKTIKKEDQTQMIRGNKFNQTNTNKEHYHSDINSKSNSRSKGNRSKDKQQAHSPSLSPGHYQSHSNEVNSTCNYNNDKTVQSNKVRSKSNQNELHTYNNPNSIPLIVKPNEQFTLANNDECSHNTSLSLDKGPKTNTNPIFKSSSAPKTRPYNYSPSQKSGNDIIRQIKKDNRTNNLIKRYRKYHNGFVTLDIITRLTSMKKFITRLSLKVIKLKLPYLISAIESYQYTHMGKRLLYELWSNHQKYYMIKHHLFLLLKKRLFKVLKQNKKISLHLKRGYYGSLVSKAFWGIKNNKHNRSIKKQRYNRIAFYYYNKLMKKAWMTIKFYHHIHNRNEKYKDNDKNGNEYDNYPEGKFNSLQCIDQSAESHYEKVFNFFHMEDEAKTDANPEETVKTNKAARSFNRFDKGSIYSSISMKGKEGEVIEEDKREECTEGNQYGENSSMSQVNSLIDHLEGRLQSMNKKTNCKGKSKGKCKGQSNNKNKSILDHSTNTSIKGRNNKVIMKSSKETNELCPYCVSGLEHEKCTVQTNTNTECKSNTVNPSNAKILLLGAPNFIRNTSTFIHKKLK